MLFKSATVPVLQLPLPQVSRNESNSTLPVGFGRSNAGIFMPILEKLFLFIIGVPEQEKSIQGELLRDQIRSKGYFWDQISIVLSFLCYGTGVPADIYFTNLSDGAAAGAPRSSRDSPSAIEASSPLASRRAVSGAMPAFRAMMRPAASQ